MGTTSKYKRSRHVLLIVHKSLGSTQLSTSEGQGSDLKLATHVRFASGELDFHTPSKEFTKVKDLGVNPFDV